MNHSQYYDLRSEYERVKTELEEYSLVRRAELAECLDAQVRYLASLSEQELLDLLKNHPAQAETP